MSETLRKGHYCTHLVVSCILGIVITSTIMFSKKLSHNQHELAKIINLLNGRKLDSTESKIKNPSLEPYYKKVNVTATYVQEGGNGTFDCKWNLPPESHEFDSLRWSHRDVEFLRFSPSSIPQLMVNASSFFTVDIDTVSLSTDCRHKPISPVFPAKCLTVRLSNFSRDAGGKFRCDVVSKIKDFAFKQMFSDSVNVTIIYPPTLRPRITRNPLRFIVPPSVVEGGSVDLDCLWDRWNSVGLHVLQIFHNSTEFYRFQPRSSPERVIQDTPGLFVVEPEYSSGGRIRLKNISRDAGGSFKCETTYRQPFKQSISVEKNFTVEEVPPLIALNCTPDFVAFDGKRCLHISTFPRHWEAAQLWCRDMGSNLAWFAFSNDTRTKLREFFTEKSLLGINYWLGGEANSTEEQSAVIFKEMQVPPKVINGTQNEGSLFAQTLVSNATDGPVVPLMESASCLYLVYPDFATYRTENCQRLAGFICETIPSN